MSNGNAATVVIFMKVLKHLMNVQPANMPGPILNYLSKPIKNIIVKVKRNGV